MMNKYTHTLLAAMTVFITGCQSIAPAQLNIPVVDVSYVLENAQTNSNAEIESLNGKGNNAANPNWGSANIQLIRVAPAAYTDGISSPSGADRPSARMISNTFSVSPADGIPNNRDFTAFVYAWGQFLDHDIDLTVSASPKETLPVIVPAGDEWFDPSNTGAMTIPMSRSNYDVTTGTALNNPRQQINSITAFIDGSQIYGIDAQRAAALREFSGGRMKTSDGNLLPFNSNGFENANDAHVVDDNKLFLAGDVAQMKTRNCFLCIFFLSVNITGLQPKRHSVILIGQMKSFINTPAAL